MAVMLRIDHQVPHVGVINAVTNNVNAADKFITVEACSAQVGITKDYLVLSTLASLPTASRKSPTCISVGPGLYSYR